VNTKNPRQTVSGSSDCHHGANGHYKIQRLMLQVGAYACIEAVGLVADGSRLSALTFVRN
jgi:hypothetical protein